MKTSRALPFTFLLAATTVFSQNLHPDTLYRSAPRLDAVGANCPLDIAIDRGGLYEKREVQGAPSAEPGVQVEQRIRLDLTNRNPAKILAAQITIHGLSQKIRYVELSTPNADTAQTFHLSLNLGGNSQASKVFWLTRFAVITRVDLNSVTYANGLEWREPAPVACSVAPSLMMPVAVGP